MRTTASVTVARGRAGTRRTAAPVVLLLVAAGVVGCTSEPVDPARAGTVVVTTDLPFASLNGATAAGRTPGSVLVRGLVQSGFTTLGPDGTVTADPSFGTVEKVADQPLTVRYTIAPTARWSDGVPVTPADLLLEWAARSGQLDEVVPELDEDGVVEPTADDVVLFGAPSAALARASAVPVVDGATLTLVYDAPVADWQVALDVNLPAHVVGRVALAPAPSPSADPSSSPPVASSTADPTADASPSADPSAAPERDAAAWADAVATAVQQQDRAALVAVSRTWRTAGVAGDVAADPVLTTTTGPYVLDRVDDAAVEAVRNDAYEGDAPAAFDRVRLRADLDPLAQLEAVAADEVDVAVPVSTADVLAAAEDLEDVTLRTGGDAVLQLVLQESAGGVFDPASSADATDPAAAAAGLRSRLVAAVRREEVVAAAVQPLWARAVVSDVVSAQVGAASAGTAEQPEPPAAGEGDGPEVRLLASRAEPVRAAVLEHVAERATDAGFAPVLVEADDPAGTMRARPESWDAALVPVAQEDLPVAAFVARWRSGGATNVTGHADPELDALLDTLAATTDPQAATEGLRAAAQRLAATGAVLPLVRTPVLTVAAVRTADTDEGLPVLPDVPVLAPSGADLTAWWGWARVTGR